MAGRRDIYGQISDEADMCQIFRDIRQDVAKAGTRPSLTELYRRAGYLITLTYAPSWTRRFGRAVRRLRRVAEGEFRLTARRINRRARQIGTAADYHETWGAVRPVRVESGRRAPGSARHSDLRS